MTKKLMKTLSSQEKQQFLSSKGVSSLDELFKSVEVEDNNHESRDKGMVLINEFCRR